jgi:ribosomal protein S18 acetylase RimI-like enzyme
VAAVSAIEAALFGMEAWPAATVESELLGPGRVSMVAAGVSPDLAAVLGYVVLMTAGDVADLNRIAVRPGHQRQGLASRLLSAGIEQVRLTGVRRMLLEVGEGNEGAIAFYARAGFAEISRRERYYRDGSAAIVMEMRLTHV